MTLKDARGEPVSTTNQRSLERFERAVELAASYFVDPLAEIEAALAEDPDFAMGHAFKAALGVMAAEKGALALVERATSELERLGARANARERAHLAAARSWLEGDFARAVRLYGDVLLDHPRDLVALQTAHIGDFLLGQSQMLRDRVAQVVPRWSQAVPGFGYVLGMYTFGLEETGLYDRADEVGRRALELNRRDPWAVHALAHVREMRGEIPEGIDVLESRVSDWSPDNAFAFHNWWHLGLFYLDLGRHDRVLEIYDRNIHPKTTQIAYENVDAAALLWRLTLRGVDVKDRWRSVADGWEATAEDGFYAFNDAHAAIAFAAAGRLESLERTFRAMELAASGGGTNAMMTREVGLPLARAIAAFVRGDFSESAEVLLGIRTIANRFGGSHAQRDLIHLTLIEAAMRAGNGKLASALAAERTALKPSNPFSWHLAARALELEGDRPAAEEANRRARAARG